jgi:two-component sensor histidine kinase
VSPIGAYFLAEATQRKKIMGKSISGLGIVIQFPGGRSLASDTREQYELHAVTAELGAVLARIEALREENGHLKQRQDTLIQEFEQRLVNSLQVIESLLPGQVRPRHPRRTN